MDCLQKNQFQRFNLKTSILKDILITLIVNVHSWYWKNFKNSFIIQKKVMLTQILNFSFVSVDALRNQKFCHETDDYLPATFDVSLNGGVPELTRLEFPIRFIDFCMTSHKNQISFVAKR